LEYRSLRFETDRLTGDYQGTAIVNYADTQHPHTRIVEHKHFALQQSASTVITREYPQTYEPGGEAFYPIADERNLALFERYRVLARSAAPGVIFGGRLGSYKYYDMHQVIAEASHRAAQEVANQGIVRKGSAAGRRAA
jgi:UDP-galactopyranose mutase